MGKEVRESVTGEMGWSRMAVGWGALGSRVVEGDEKLRGWRGPEGFESRAGTSRRAEGPEILSSQCHKHEDVTVRLHMHVTMMGRSSVINEVVITNPQTTTPGSPSLRRGETPKPAQLSTSVRKGHPAKTPTEPS